MWAHLQDEPPAVTSARPELPPAIDAVIAQALAKAPKARYATCSAMVAAARAALVPGAPVVAPAATTRAHASPIAPAPAGATRVNAANAAPPLAAAPATAAAAPPLAAPTAADWPPASASRAHRPPSARAGPSSPASSRSWPWSRVAGYVAGQSGSDDAPPASKVASNDDLAVSYNANWTPRRRARRRPRPRARLPDRPAVGERPHRRRQDRPPGPRACCPSASARPRKTDVVSLDRTPALRHTGVPTGAGASATVFVVSTEDGPQAIACAGATPEGLRGRGGDPAAEDRRRARHPARRGLRDGADRAAGRPRPRARAPTGAPWRARGTRTTQAAAAAAAARAQAALASARPRSARARGRGRGQRGRRRRDRRHGDRLQAPARPPRARTTPPPTVAPAPRCAAAQARLAAAIGALQLLGYRVAARCVSCASRPLARGRSSRSSRWPFPPSRSRSRRPTTTT